MMPATRAGTRPLRVGERLTDVDAPSSSSVSAGAARPTVGGSVALTRGAPGET